MEKLQKTSVSDLIKVWIDMMRANTQHMLIEDATRWNSSLGYNKSIENIELVIYEKLQITSLESKIMLNSKKKVVYAKEKKLFKTKNQKTIQKKKKKENKYLTRLTHGMGLIQTEIFHTHHAITKLDNMIGHEQEEEEI